MKKKFLSMLVCIGFCIANPLLLFCQELPVDLFTGTPSIEVPIWNVSGHDLSEPIRLYYNADGIRVDEPTGQFGVGWGISSANYSVTREVRGLPDDFKGTSSDLRQGWLYGTHASTLPTFGASSYASCVNENADYNTINGFGYNLDTEPDVYSFNIGTSGQFVFDNNKIIRLMPFQDIDIQPTYVSATDRTITAFTITDNKGIKYFFNSVIQVTKWTEKSSGVNSVEYLKRDFEQYNLNRYGTKVIYNSEWKLTRIESPSGGYLNFNYVGGSSSDNTDNFNIYIRKSAGDFMRKWIYLTRTQSTSKNLSSITSSSGQSANFIYTNDLLTEIQIRDSRNSNSPFLFYTLEYNTIGVEGSNATGNYERAFLKSVQKSSSNCDKLPPTKFTYYGLNLTNLTSPLPNPSTTTAVDHWGYFNGKTGNSFKYPTIYVFPALAQPDRFRLYDIPGYTGERYVINGAVRSANLQFAKTGSLILVNHAEGGSTIINYGLHKFYDPISNSDIEGGGLRVEKVTYYDGEEPTEIISKKFTYETTPGKSSGRLISNPSYVIPISEYHDPETGAVKSFTSLTGQALWEHFTPRTENSILASGELNVAYGTVTVARPGAGFAKFEFQLPAVFGASSDGLWQATQSRFVRNSSCPANGMLSQNAIWSFPYSVNPNYGFERGQVIRKTEYNENNKKTKQFDYTYQLLNKSGSTPFKVWGLNYNNYANNNAIFVYGKYFLLTDVIKVPLTESVTDFDPLDEAKTITSTVQYDYGSSFHKLLTTITQVDQLGNVFRTRMKYPLDYGTIVTPTDKQAEMIKALQTNFRNGDYIESWNTIQKVGDTEKVATANLVMFSDFGLSKILPSALLAKVVNAPTAAHTPSSVDGAGKFQYDLTNYIEVQKTLGYGPFNKPLGVVGLDRIKSSTHWGYNNTIPIVSATNASFDEFSFSNFETTTGYEFQQSASIYGAGRTGSNGLYPQVKLTRAIQKANVPNYILSFWFKKLSTPIDFRVIIKQEGGSTVYYDNTFTVNPATSEYELVKRIIPAGSFPTRFVVEFQSTMTGTLPVSSSSLLPMIDDVSFYPEDAALTSYTYTIPHGINSVTGPQGGTNFVVLDGLGRTKFELDQDKNILKRNTYTFYASPVVLSADFTLPAQLHDQTSLTFRVDGNQCMDGETYEWDFGAGYISTGTIPSASYTYNTIGSKTVTCRVSHPDYGTSIITKTFDVVYKPIQLTICAKGVSQFDNCNNQVKSLFSCTNITETVSTTAPHYQTNFLALHDRGGETVSFQWLVRSSGSSTWRSVGANNTYLAELAYPFTSYDVKCIATTSYGRTGESPVTTVFVLNCGDF